MKTNEYIVIGAELIAPVETPPFSKGKYYSEKEYLDYLVSVQDLINEYDIRGEVQSIHYESMKDIETNAKEENRRYNFCVNFMGMQAITVKQTEDGLYKLASNGRHRLYVARKYGLKLLVKETNV